jgi:hypothetical protein
MEPEVKPVEITDDSQLEAGYSDAPAAVPEPPKLPEVDVKDLLDRFEKLEVRTRNAEGHIGGLNHQQKLLQENLQAASNKAAAQVTSAPTQAQVTEAAANPAEWDALKADFPEWSMATEKFLDAKLSKIKSDPTAITKLQTEFGTKLEMARYEDALDALDVTFEGWKAEVSATEPSGAAFRKWMATQTPEVQALADSNKFSAAAQMLRLYEKSKVKPVVVPKVEISARQRRLEAAVNPRGSGGLDGSARTELDYMEEGYK